MSRRYSRADRLISQLDSAMRTMSGANGQPRRDAPATPPGTENRSRAPLRTVHNSLTASLGVHAGQQVGLKAASMRRQNEQRIESGKRALNQTVDALRDRDVEPSPASAMLYAGGFTLGLFSSVLGSERAARSIVLDTARRQRQTLQKTMDELGAESESKLPDTTLRDCVDQIAHTAGAYDQHNNDMGGMATSNSRVSRPVSRLLDAAGKVIEGK